MFVFGRIHIIRSFVIFLSRRPLSKNYGKGHSLLENFEVANVIESLRNDGLYLGINLPKNLLQEILDFSTRTIYIGDGNPNFCFYIAEKEKAEIKRGKPFRNAYTLNPSLLCPAIKKLENDPYLWVVAANYLETDPVLIGSQMWWTFGIQDVVNKSNEHHQGIFRFHYDLEDYRYLKFMFYLTDVDLTSGCHVCVKGSHKKKKLSHQFSLFKDKADKDIIDHYGIENVINISGSSGFGFAEDPFCFHKGTIPVRSNRLILEVKFASYNYEFEAKKSYL